MAKKQALLVMDMVNEYIYGDKPLLPINERVKTITAIKKVINLAHKKKIPVIFINSAFRESDPILKVIGYRQQAMAGTPGAQVILELKPKIKDYQTTKHGYDGFWQSDLE